MTQLEWLKEKIEIRIENSRKTMDKSNVLKDGVMFLEASGAVKSLVWSLSLIEQAEGMEGSMKGHSDHCAFITDGLECDCRFVQPEKVQPIEELEDMFTKYDDFYVINKTAAKINQIIRSHNELQRRFNEMIEKGED